MFRTVFTAACVLATATAVKLMEPVDQPADMPVHTDMAPDMEVPTVHEAFEFVKNVVDSGEWEENKAEIVGMVMGMNIPKELEEVADFLKELYIDNEDDIDQFFKELFTTLAGGDDAEIDIAVGQMMGHLMQMWESEEFAAHRAKLESHENFEDISQAAGKWLRHFVMVAKKSDGVFEGKDERAVEMDA